MKKFLTIITSLICLVAMSGCFKTDDSKTASVPDNSPLLTAHYIDVGQGDSIFIELPNKKTMLIDAGESKYSKTVSQYIKALGYSKIDYLVATHPHSDHIGGLKGIINDFELDKIYMPDVVHTSKTYENLLLAISDKQKKITKAKAGVNISSSDNLSIDIVAPVKDKYKSLNNYSVVIKIKYFNRSFLFTGDAESESEGEITADVKADVLKVGHHGSSTSTTQKFLDAVNPSYAVISVGKDNDYNHPNAETIKKLEKKGCTLLRTDKNGNIVIKTDGNSIDVSTQKK